MNAAKRSASSKPSIAIVSNSQTPYRLHLHQRIAQELREVELWSVFTHEVSSSPWQVNSSSDIRSVFFGEGERSEDQSKWRNQWHEWGKGGRILTWLSDHGVRAVVLLGYNDAGRLRIIQWCHQNHIPCILFGDSNILGERFTGWKLVLKRIAVSMIVRRCAAVLHCGRLGEQYFKHYGAVSDALFPFPYEPDYKVFGDVSAAATEAIRRRYHLRSDRRYLIYSGRLVSVKRVDLLIKAFATVSNVRPLWDLIIVGDGPLRSSLEASVPKEVIDRITWTGFVGDAVSLAALYRCADVLVLPSDNEPWGIVVTEAAAGLALVCTSVVGAAADLLEDGVNGRIVPPGSDSALADALVDVTSPSKVDAMKAASPTMLSAWRSRSDPVNGLRKALQFVGVISENTVQ
jgi:glycosyltransferase involved in cell wall biosynthesis